MVWNKGLTKKSNEIIDRIAKKNSKLFKDEPERFIERNKKISQKLKGRTPWNKGLKLGKQSKELVKKRTRNSKKKRSMIKYYKRNHPFLFIVDEIRENKNKELEARCKKCGKFFILKGSQLYERIRAIETPGGVEENNLYCSNECKLSCDIYRKRTCGISNEKTYTYEEYQTFRQFVLERDNYICQYCGKQATHVHHERPQKLEPFFSLDPDYGWSCCERCHYEKGHKDECSTGNLSNKVC